MLRDVEGISDPGMGLYPPQMRRDLGVGRKGNYSLALIP